MRIAIFSSWLPIISSSNREFIKKISQYCCEKNITIVTGGCNGIPSIAVENTFNCGGTTIGYFPFENIDKYHTSKHKENTDESLSFYSKSYFIKGFNSRSLAMIHNVDAAIVINGRIGTLSEATMAIEEELPLLVFEDTKGIASELKNIIKKTGKKITNKIMFNKKVNYKKAINNLLSH
ncbi:MAG: hypothetical protein ACI9AR_000064 [Flavobacteriaceae bacterium]|jgi:uncharacterized protein (TIGR00725 family)